MQLLMVLLVQLLVVIARHLQQQAHLSTGAVLTAAGVAAIRVTPAAPRVTPRAAVSPSLPHQPAWKQWQQQQHRVGLSASKQPHQMAQQQQELLLVVLVWLSTLLKGLATVLTLLLILRLCAISGSSQRAVVRARCSSRSWLALCCLTLCGRRMRRSATWRHSCA